MQTFPNKLYHETLFSPSVISKGEFSAGTLLGRVMFLKRQTLLSGLVTRLQSGSLNEFFNEFLCFYKLLSKLQYQN